MFPNKAKMVRSANFLFVMLAVAPGVYLVVAGLVTFGNPGLARDPNIIPLLFVGLALFSLGNIGVTIFIQTSKKLMAERARYDPVGRTYLIMATGAILSEANAIYGLVLALLSGSIFYEVRIRYCRVGKSLVGPETIQAESRKPSGRIDPAGAGFFLVRPIATRSSQWVFGFVDAISSYLFLTNGITCFRSFRALIGVTHSLPVWPAISNGFPPSLVFNAS